MTHTGLTTSAAFPNSTSSAKKTYPSPESYNREVLGRAPVANITASGSYSIILLLVPSVFSFTETPSLCILLTR